MQSQLVQRFIEAAKSYGTKTAVVDWPDGATLRRTSYNALLDNARRVAAYLQSHNIAPQAFITLELPAGMEFLAAEMGVWMARCVAVPVGITFPDERKAYIRTHCEAALNIDGAMMAEILLMPLSEASAPLTVDTDNALLVYTSGSTGTPKGILHDHRSLALNGLRMFDIYNLTPDDRFAGGIPPYFIAAIYYWKLLLGVEVHMVPPDINKDILRMARYHADHDITIAFVSATVFPLYRCVAPSMRVVITGSDRVICREKPAYRVENTYGMSETVGPVIHTQISDPTENAPIGLPIQGVEFAILDDNLQPVPQGEEGEICLKGYFCKEYFKDEERTRELYRGGWLHTNDLGRLLPDGRIQFVNRKDWMVKVNGQRVEPGEVEATMCSIEGVSRAVVKGFLNASSGSQYLVGYYTVKSEEIKVKSEEVMAFLQQKLPSYMVPSFLVPLEAFPLNANGKIDRKSLQAPARSTETASYEAPRNEVEAALCDIMARAMGLDKVGINDDFRRLGGDSIQMMTLQQLCADSSVPQLHAISTAIIHQGGTPCKMAAMLSEVQPRAKRQLDDYPLSDEQRNIYFDPCLRDEGQVRSSIPFLYRLDGQIDMPRLMEAIAQALAAHQGLFTRFFINDKGEARQKMVVEPLPLEVERMTAEAFETEKAHLMQPFSLLNDRLFRLRLFDVAGTHYLFLNIHHIIYDGTSHQILLRDIDRAYRGFAVAPEEWAMADMAAEVAATRGTASYDQALQWHKAMLAPAQRIEGDWSEGNLRFAFYPLSVGLDELEQACQRYGVTANILTTAAYLFMLGAYTGKRDLAVCSVFNGRQSPEVLNTVGLLARHIVVPAAWSDDMSCADYIANLRQTMLDSMAYSIVEADDIRQLLGAYPKLEFIYQGEIKNNIAIDGHALTMEDVPMPDGGRDSGLYAHIYTSREHNSMSLMVMAVDSWRDEAYRQRMAQRYTQCLRGLMTARTLGEVQCLVPEEDRF